jgi:hypothetical protein
MPLVDGQDSEVLTDILLHRRNLNVLYAGYSHERNTTEVIEVLAVEEIAGQCLLRCGIVRLRQYLWQLIVRIRRPKRTVSQPCGSDSAGCHDS